MSYPEKIYSTPPLVEEELSGSQRMTQRLGDTAIQTVRVVVVKGDEVLTGLRKNGTNPHSSGKEEFLGGKLDPEDATLDLDTAIIRAGLRELDEEGGVQVELTDDPRVLRVHTIANGPEEGERVGVTVVEYLLRAMHIGGAPRPSEEHQSVAWRHPNTIVGNPDFRAGTDLALRMAGLTS